jgi:hypothetical protein
LKGSESSSGLTLHLDGPAAVIHDAVRKEGGKKAELVGERDVTDGK